eukprot:GHVS01026094.1.p1 GENE.GHVS01026094.1~~GHVS01026094.1.p1  ORF type:complete len:110 (-),score=7.00 GHVS01026094.1:626-955(-)
MESLYSVIMRLGLPMKEEGRITRPASFSYPSDMASASPIQCAALKFCWFLQMKRSRLSSIVEKDRGGICFSEVPKSIELAQQRDDLPPVQRSGQNLGVPSSRLLRRSNN